MPYFYNPYCYGSGVDNHAFTCENAMGKYILAFFLRLSQVVIIVFGIVVCDYKLLDVSSDSHFSGLLETAVSPPLLQDQLIA